MADISKINAVTLADIADLDGVLAANIAKVNGLVFTTATGAFLLDTYTGAAAAYSTRKLKTGVTVAARIRRSGDDIEADVEFDSNNEISLTSPISNASSGTYTDLADFVDHTGTARDAFIDEWKDQSGSGNHASQATFGNQPQLYDATTGLIIKNGKAAVNFDGVTDSLASSVSFNHNGHTYTVGTGDASNIEFALCMGGSSGERFETVFDQRTLKRHTIVADTSTNVIVLDTQPTVGQQYLLSNSNDSGTIRAYVDGVAQSDTLTSYSALAINTIRLALFPAGGGLSNGDIHLQEAIIYNVAGHSNHSAIETNINSDFLIYQPTDAPTSGLLSTYTGAAAAYSVRQLSNKAVIALRIRRDSDDEERNIGFDSNGDLDTQAISDFCDTANGYVTRWWDQSTNGNHADQATDASQPQIYNGTAVITDNGKPAVQFQDTSDVFNISATGSGSLSLFVAGYFSMNNAWVFQADGILNSPDGIALTMDNQNGGAAAFYRGGYTTQKITGISAGQKLASNVFVSGTGSTLRVNGTTAGQDTTSLGTTAWAVTGTSPIFKQFSAGTVRAQEFVLYFSDQSSNRTGIESDINGYFSIYT